MLKLVGTDGGKYYSWEMLPGKYLIGRKTECDLCVPHQTVSRRHAELEVTQSGDRFYLADLGSHNGTTVNDVELHDRIEIKSGDRIMFGQTEFKLLPAEDPSAQPRTILTEDAPQNSVYLSINEALKPLPQKITDQANLLPTIFDMAKLLVLTEPREAMLQRSLEMVAKVIPAERLAVLFSSENNQEVYTAASLTPGTKAPGDLTLSRTIVNEIMTNKNAILISDPQADPRFAQQASIIMSAMKSALAVPLFDEGRVLGILYADTTDPRHSYTDEHLRVLATFGNIIASRLVNYELARERQAKQVIEKELRRASSIQKGLLVDCPPQVDGYEVCAYQEQSRSVGGDLYDVYHLPDGKLLFMVADVSGKGMGAALLMSNILASFRILYDASSFDLGGAVRRVSGQLFKSTKAEDFATLMIGLLDPATNTVKFINAGHNPPLLVRKNGELEYLQPCGIMIGAMDFPGWEEKTVTLEEGDLIFVFSDGVTEADSGNELYGDKRTEQFVISHREEGADQITRALMDDIKAFVGDAPQSDDITTLILKRGSH